MKLDCFELHDDMLCIRSDEAKGLIRMRVKLSGGKTAWLDFLTLIQPKNLFGLVSIEVQEPEKSLERIPEMTG